MKKIIIDGNNLKIEDLYHISHAKKDEYQVEISDIAISLMQKSREFVLEIVKKEEPVYGINTGFGALSSKHIPVGDLSQLQVNLIRSHCTGVGTPFNRENVRAIMLLRANCLSSGYSGVTIEVVKQILTYLNNDIIPFIPEKGSVGASGDLAPLSHLALTLIGEGKVFYNGVLSPTKDILNKLNIKPCSLGPKDGLALINGTSVMTAVGALACYEVKNLMKLADIAGAATLEGIKGSLSPFNIKISILKPHQGQIDVCNNFEALISDSEIMDSHKTCNRVQDAYSLRCIPQVHGACRQTLAHAWSVVSTELNSVTDNPLIFTEDKQVFSGGNFHGQAISFAMDYLCMGVAELCNISERRIEKMMNPAFSDLPAFLTKNSGLNSGLMIAQVTAAALVSENKIYCHPASVDSVPTSTDKEDHVSMGVTAARKLLFIIENLKHVLSIEFLCNTQALYLQKPLKSSPSIQALHSLISKEVAEITDDRVFADDMNHIYNLISNNSILNTVEKVAGELK
jgi:histidine ammonia-lyase